MSRADQFSSKRNVYGCCLNYSPSIKRKTHSSQNEFMRDDFRTHIKSSRFSVIITIIIYYASKAAHVGDS